MKNHEELLRKLVSLSGTFGTTPESESVLVAEELLKIDDLYERIDCEQFAFVLRASIPDYCKHGRSTSGTCGVCDGVVDEDGNYLEDE